MYVFHLTSHKYIMSILKTGKILSGSVTGNLEIGFGIYGNNLSRFIFFSTCSKIFDKRINSHVIIYFKPEFLYDCKYYLSTGYAADPPSALKLPQTAVITKMIKKRDNSFLRYLKQLYLYSVSLSNNGFYAFNQIAIKDKLNIKEYMVGIEFQYEPTFEIIKYLVNNYPDVKIKINKQSILYGRLLIN